MANRDILDRAASFAFRQLDAHNQVIESLSPQLQTFLRVYSAQGILDNGGLQYLFESDFDKQPPYSKFVEAYQSIGAVDAAQALSQAVALFPFADPHLDANRRQQTMDYLWNDDDSFGFGDLDNALCGNESVWSHLREFVEKHRSSFGLT